MVQATLSRLVEKAVVALSLNQVYQALTELDTYISLVTSIRNVREEINYLLLVAIDAENKLSLLS